MVTLHNISQSTSKYVHTSMWRFCIYFQCTPIQTVRVLCSYVECTNISWGFTGLHGKIYIFLYTITYHAYICVTYVCFSLPVIKFASVRRKNTVCWGHHYI